MKVLTAKKNPTTALLLALCPGLGFLYLENIKYWLVFMILPLFPLLFIGNMGSTSILVSVILYGLSIYYTYFLANESLKNQRTYKKDPYFILCLSVILDGLGQFKLKQYKIAYVMMTTGFTSCLLGWVVLIKSYGFMELILAEQGTMLFNITNGMIVWTLVALPIKALSLIDAYYSTYHLYVAKK